MAQIHVTSIHGEQFALGLFWQQIPPGRDSKKEARALGETLYKDLFVIRDGENLQAGFAAQKDGAKDGLYSLAAAISKGALEQGVTGSILAIFELPDSSYAFIATNEGMFLPEGDFGGSFDEVKDKLAKVYSLGIQWNHIILPPEFQNFAPGQHRLLDDFLPKKNGKVKVHKWWALEPIKKTFPVKKFVSLIAISALLGIGYSYYNKIKLQQEEAEKARKLEIARQMFSQQQLQATEHLAHPWASQMQASEFVDQCLSQIRDEYISPGLWQLSSFTCNQGSVQFTWDRGSSNINALMKKVTDAVVDDAGDKATLTINVPMSGTNTDDVTASAIVAKANFYSYFQAKGLSTKLVEEIPPPPPPNPDGTPSTPTAIRDWRTFNFQIQSTISPTKFKDLFDYPVIRLNKMVMTLGKDKTGAKLDWKLEGALYSGQ